MSNELLTGYVDVQVNGYVGVDFNNPATTIAEIKKSAEAMVADGVAVAFPTVITADLDAMCGCIRNLVLAIEDDDVVANVFRGLHIEGPFLSRLPGFIGAHPPEHARCQDLSALETLCDACGPLLKLVTLAPEVDADGAMTKFCVERGVLVAAGHTDATLDQLEQCVANGLSLFTHLGNGCPRMMDRHDNIIYRALRLSNELSYTLIADSFHVPSLLFQNLIEWIPADRLLVVSDAISAAGLGPGVYQLGCRQVRIGEDKAARDASGEHFVGAASTMRDADTWLTNTLGLDQAHRRRLLVSNASQLFAM